MKAPHLLNLGNARKVKDNLSSILSLAALSRIESEIEANAIALLNLGERYYRFAMSQSAPNWRQKVSRLYYAAYNVARAVRLYTSGEYFTDTKDHQRFDRLPQDFPSRERYVNQLSMLREDRNMSDYDHTARAADLVLRSTQSAALVTEFLDDARSYLQARGLTM